MIYFFNWSSCSGTERKSQCRTCKKCDFLLLNENGERREEWCFCSYQLSKKSERIDVKIVAKRVKYFDGARLFRSLS